MECIADPAYAAQARPWRRQREWLLRRFASAQHASNPTKIQRRSIARLQPWTRLATLHTPNRTNPLQRSKRGNKLPEPQTESLTLPVLGMTCASCQHHVEEALRSTAGVQSARVDLMAHRATVVFDPAVAAPAALIEAIRSAGYDAVLPRSDASSAGPSDGLAAGAERKAWVTLAAGAAAM